MGRGCKSGESVELRKSAEDISREVDPFRAARRVATKTARVCGGGRTVCFFCQKVSSHVVAFFVTQAKAASKGLKEPSVCARCFGV